MYIRANQETQDPLIKQTRRSSKPNEQQFHFENQQADLEVPESKKPETAKGNIQEAASVMEDKSRKIRSEIANTQETNQVQDVEEDILRDAIRISCMDLEDATASLQISDSGTLLYEHFYDESLTWSMDITPEELKKIHDLIDNTKGLEHMFYDQTFWTKFLKDEIDVTQFAQFGNQMNQLKNGDTFLKEMPKSVQSAWKKAAEETGFLGFGADSSGALQYWSEFAKKYYDDILAGAADDAWRKTKDGMVDFANNALQSLNQEDKNLFSKRVQNLKRQEKAFYQVFLRNLNV